MEFEKFFAFFFLRRCFRNRRETTCGMMVVRGSMEVYIVSTIQIKKFARMGSLLRETVNVITQRGEYNVEAGTCWRCMCMYLKFWMNNRRSYQYNLVCVVFSKWYWKVFRMKWNTYGMVPSLSFCIFLHFMAFRWSFREVDRVGETSIYLDTTDRELTCNLCADFWVFRLIGGRRELDCSLWPFECGIVLGSVVEIIWQFLFKN